MKTLDPYVADVGVYEKGSMTLEHIQDCRNKLGRRGLSLQVKGKLLIVTKE